MHTAVGLTEGFVRNSEVGAGRQSLTCGQSVLNSSMGVQQFVLA